MSAGCPRASIFHPLRQSAWRQNSTRSAGGIERTSLDCVPSGVRDVLENFFSTLCPLAARFFCFLFRQNRLSLLLPRPSLQGIRAASAHLSPSRFERTQEARSPYGSIRAIKEPPRHATHPRASHPARQRHRRRRRRRRLAGNKRGRAANRHRHFFFNELRGARSRSDSRSRVSKSSRTRGKRRRGNGRGCRAGVESWL